LSNASTARRRRGVPHPIAQCRVTDQAGDRRADRIDITRRDDEAGLTVGNRLVRAAARSRDGRNPRTPRPRGDDPETFGLRPCQRSRQHIANTSAHAYNAGRSALETRRES